MLRNSFCRSPGDVRRLTLQPIIQTAKRFLWAGEVSDQDTVIFGANAHARADSHEKPDEFLQRFRIAEQIVGPGAVEFTFAFQIGPMMLGFR